MPVGSVWIRGSDDGTVVQPGVGQRGRGRHEAAVDVDARRGAQGHGHAQVGDGGAGLVDLDHHIAVLAVGGHDEAHGGPGEVGWQVATLAVGVAGGDARG